MRPGRTHRVRPSEAQIGRPGSRRGEEAVRIRALGPRGVPLRGALVAGGRERGHLLCPAIDAGVEVLDAAVEPRDLRLEVRGARPPTDEALGHLSVAPDEACRVHELTSRGHEAPARLTPHEIQRDVEAGHEDDVAEEGVHEPAHLLLAVDQLTQAALDPGAEAREEGVVGGRRAIGGTDAGRDHDGDLTDLLAGAPVDDASGHVGVPGHEGLGALTEDGVDGTREPDVRTEVIRDEAEQFVLAARPFAARAGFEHAARSAREILELTLPIEERLHTAAVPGALDVCVRALLPKRRETRSLRFERLACGDMGRVGHLDGGDRRCMRGLEPRALLGHARESLLGSAHALRHALEALLRGRQRLGEVHPAVLGGGPLVKPLENAVVLGLDLAAQLLVRPPELASLGLQSTRALLGSGGALPERVDLRPEPVEFALALTELLLEQGCALTLLGGARRPGGDPHGELSLALLQGTQVSGDPRRLVTDGLELRDDLAALLLPGLDGALALGPSLAQAVEAALDLLDPRFELREGAFVVDEAVGEQAGAPLRPLGLRHDVLLRLPRLDLERANAAAKLTHDVLEARDVLLAALQPQLGLVPALAVAGDAGRLLEDGPPLPWVRGEDGVDPALLEDGVAPAAHAGVEEQVLDVLQAHPRAVDEVLALAARVEPAGDRHLGAPVREGGLARGRVLVVQDHRDLGGAHGGSARRALEDDVRHPRAAHRGGTGLAEHPADGVHHVALPAPVRSDDAGQGVPAEVHDRPVGEGLEAEEFEAFEAHGIERWAGGGERGTWQIAGPVKRVWFRAPRTGARPGTVEESRIGSRRPFPADPPGASSGADRVRLPWNPGRPRAPRPPWTGPCGLAPLSAHDPRGRPGTR